METQFINQKEVNVCSFYSNFYFTGGAMYHYLIGSGNPEIAQGYAKLEAARTFQIKEAKTRNIKRLKQIKCMGKG